ncbi:MAG: 5-formyltetrahydrofolate cyclo-ligase, partial [Ruminococcus sp.]|nr:5-formyltetrahydrofolate cyclo-ligase [Ruminococcus sp.]
MSAEEKLAFRREILSRRKALPAERLAESSRLIAENVIGSEEYKNADTLLCFVPTDIEVDT